MTFLFAGVIAIGAGVAIWIAFAVDAELAAEKDANEGWARDDD